MDCYVKERVKDDLVSGAIRLIMAPFMKIGKLDEEQVWRNLVSNMFSLRSLLRYQKQKSQLIQPKSSV